MGNLHPKVNMVHNLFMYANMIPDIFLRKILMDSYRHYEKTHDIIYTYMMSPKNIRDNYIKYHNKQMTRCGQDEEYNCKFEVDIVDDELYSYFKTVTLIRCIQNRLIQYTWSGDDHLRQHFLRKFTSASVYRGSVNIMNAMDEHNRHYMISASIHIPLEKTKFRQYFIKDIFILILRKLSWQDIVSLMQCSADTFVYITLECYSNL